MDPEPGRTANFGDGALRVREPEFHTAQQNLMGKYRRTSILDSLQPSGNGMSHGDAERQMYGFRGSASGQSEQTLDKSIWIRDEKQAQTREQIRKSEG